MRYMPSVKHTTAACLLGISLVYTQVASSLPAPFSAEYTVNKGKLKLGNLKAKLRYSGNTYQYHKSTKSTGLAAMLTGVKITERTSGVFSGENIIPQNYHFNQTRRSKSRVDQAKFNGKTASGSYKNKPFNINIMPGTQDRASLELVLARDLSRNLPRLNYTVVEKGRLKNYQFQKLGNQQIKTSAGTFNTIKVRVLRDSNKRDTVFWLAKEIDYLPVKIQHKEKKDVITTVLNNYKKI